MRRKSWRRIVGIRIKKKGIVKMISEARSATSSPIALTQTKKVLDSSNDFLNKVVASDVLQKDVAKSLVSKITTELKNPSGLIDYTQKIVASSEETKTIHIASQRYRFRLYSWRTFPRRVYPR